MDRAQPELLTTTEPYIQRNITVGEFLDKIEPQAGREATRRLRALLANYLSDPMADCEGEAIPVYSPEPDDD